MTRSKSLALFIGLYVLFIAVGSLWPLTGWRPLASWSPDFLSEPWPRYFTRNDLLTNLLAYLPFGYALALRSAPRHRVLGVYLALLAGVVLSTLMENLQQLMPGRVSSNLDIVLNGAGALTGALLALHHGRWLRAWGALKTWRGRWFQAGTSANLGLMLLALWFMAQFSLLPVSGIGWLHLHLRPFDRPPENLGGLNTAWFLAIFVEMLTVGAFTACLVRPGRYAGALTLLFVNGFIMKMLAATALLRINVAGGVLSLETMAAFLLALWLLLLPSLSRRRRALALVGLGMMVGVRLVLAWDFFPERSLLSVIGLAVHLAVLWPLLALAWMLTAQRGRSGR